MSQISIIIPAYHVEKYIEGCFKSIHYQTFTDFEVIAINDGSTDGTLQKLREWEQKDERIRVIDKVNEGVGVTRNLGLSLAKSPYVIFIDPDDSLHPQMLEKLYDVITKYQAPLAICGYYDCFEDSSNQYEILMPTAKEELIEMTKQKDFIFNVNPAPWNKLISRKLLIQHDLAFPTDYRSEDLAFTLMMLSHCNQVAVVNEPLYYYLANRTNNVSSTYDERILHTITALKAIMAYYREQNQFENYKQELEMIAINQVLYELQKVIYIKDKSLAMKLIEAFYQYLESEFCSWQANPYYREKCINVGMKNKLRANIYHSKQFLKIFYYLRNFLKS